MKWPKETARVLRVLAVENRLRIVQLLRGRAMCVNALAGRLGVTQGAVSQHLRIMRDAGLVIAEKRGYFVHYSLDEKILAAWLEGITGRLLSPIGEAADKGGSPCAARRMPGTAGGRRI